VWGHSSVRLSHFEGGTEEKGTKPIQPASKTRCDLNDIDTMKRTQLQAETVTRFGKSAAQWTGRATNEELREALRSGEPPARVATANGNGSDLAALIAASVAPLLAGQLNEERVSEIIEERLSSYHGTVDEGRVRELVAEALKAHPPVKVMLPSGLTIDATHQHKHFADLATLVGRKRHVWLIGAAGTGKSEAALRLAEQMGVRKALVPMHEDVTPSRLLG
jgi:dynein-related subfamily AAA family protein